MKKNLLLVDDNIDTQKTLKILLEDYFDNIFLAFDGEKGFEIYNSSPCDVVITDLYMPKLNGIELCKKIKSINKDQKIILVSAHDENDKIIQKIDCYDYYLSKPYNLDKLISYIEEILNNS